jgi:hypothetical protein
MTSAILIAEHPFFRPTIHVSPSARPSISRIPLETPKEGEKSYPFPLWSGLLTSKHRQAIGTSIWMFLWCIDRVTTESDGWGIVLGGAPVKDEIIRKCFDVNKDTVHADRERLIRGKYIAVKRTPYGFQYRVRNSRKFGVWGKKRIRENPESLPRESEQTRIPDSEETPLTKKTMQLDHAVKQQPATLPQQKDLVWGFLGIEPCGPHRFRALLENCWNSRNGELPSKVIGRAIDAWEVAEGQLPRRCPMLFEALDKLRKRESAKPANKKPRVPIGDQMIPKR